MAMLLQLLYLGLIWVASRVLPATGVSRRLMQWTYWSSMGFVFGCWLAYVLGGWLVRFPTLFIIVFVGSGWLAGVRQQMGWVAARWNGWATLHRWVCLPSALVIAQWWLACHWYQPAYRDDNVIVGVTENQAFSYRPYTLVLLRNRNAVFEVEVGRVEDSFPDGNAYWRREWWNAVRAVTVDARAGTIMIWKRGQRPICLSFQP